MKPFVALLAAASAACLLAAGVAASNPAPFHFDAAERWLQTCNDWQSTSTNCVTDPQQCAWGDEDDVADMAYGKLNAGQTVTDTLCLVTDMCNDYACPHYVDYQVSGPANLTVTLSSDRGGSWTAAPTKSSGGYMYQLCVRDPLYPAGPDYPTIPGTNGGVGYLTNYTLSVTARKTTNQVAAGLEIAQNFADGRYGYFHLLNVPCAWATP